MYYLKEHKICKKVKSNNEQNNELINNCKSKTYQLAHTCLPLDTLATRCIAVLFKMFVFHNLI